MLLFHVVLRLPPFPFTGTNTFFPAIRLPSTLSPPLLWKALVMDCDCFFNGILCFVPSRGEFF